MVEKSAAIVVSLLLLPALVLTGLISYFFILSANTMAGVGLGLVTVCFALCIVSINVTLFSKQFGPRAQLLGQTYRQALFTGRFGTAAKLWRLGFAQGLRWNLMGKLNLAAVICSVVGLVLLLAGLGLV